MPYVDHETVVNFLLRDVVRRGNPDSLKHLVVVTPQPPGTPGVDCVHGALCGNPANPANPVAHLVAGTKAVDGVGLFMLTAHCDDCHTAFVQDGAACTHAAAALHTAAGAACSAPEEA